jgi:adenylate cyclase
LSLALVVAFLFAESIVKPLLFLVSAAQKISKGDFGVRTVPTTRDEVATLTNAFNEMAAGLGERERLKEVFGKFHSKAVFAKLVKEDRLHLGGEKLAVTVFFSDIRSFTSTAEKMAPEAVVEMLNEYMSEMVAIIEKYDGVVDKYVGDAIMAVWGMPEPSPGLDAEKALRACLEMREKLRELNQRRHERGHPPIEIGMGLNSGEVIAGNIGSPSRMEYTVIGDTVNTASRMESLTKEFNTDLLINETTLQLLPKPQDFLITEAREASAKGKSGKILIYGCAGLSPIIDEAQSVSVLDAETPAADPSGDSAPGDAA